MILKIELIKIEVVKRDVLIKLVSEWTTLSDRCDNMMKVGHKTPFFFACFSVH